MRRKKGMININELMTMMSVEKRKLEYTKK
jgi:hypothetical protein